MMMVKIISIIVILSCWFPFLLPAQTDEACHYSTEGTDFRFGFMENRLRGEMHYLEITVTSRVGAEIRLTYGPGEELIEETSVNANSSVTIPIDTTLLEPSGSEVVEGKGLHLVSTAPVSVYALNYRTQSSDVAIIYPTKSLGNEYYAMCYTPHPSYTIESNSEFVILASEDNTIVEITPSVDTDQGRKAHQMFAVMLHKGQLYQVQSMNQEIFGQGDLTGSHIKSNKPIAFYSGAKSTSIPVEGRTRDHLYEQIPPTSTWGREFYIVPLALRIKDTYRILAAEDGTTVRIEGIDGVTTLNRGEYREFDLENSEACRITSTKRILLAQYCRSQTADSNTGVGDPFMTIISPVTQKINDITFEAYRSELITNIFYINIVAPSAEVNDIVLDGKNILHLFNAFPGDSYSYAQIPVSSGTHRLKSNLPNGGFLAYVYGFGERNDTESYGYGVGFNLDIQLDISGFAQNDTLLICQGSEFQIDAGNYFTDYRWNTGEKGQAITVSKEGWVSVRASTSMGCVKTDSVYVKVDNPLIDLGADRGTCIPGEIILDAGPGYKFYRWQDGSTNRTFRVEKTGTFHVTTTNINDCTASDTVEMVVFDPQFTQDYKVATDLHPDISFSNHTEHGVSYQWDFGDGETSVETSPVHHYKAVGEYQVTLVATSEFGCSNTISSTVKIIPFKLLTPNAFRPGSEIAENRVFLPVTEGIDPARYRLQIINRLGSTIYETTNPEAGWDGKLSNGTMAGPGIFIWLLQYSDVQGFQHKEKGTVMLVR